MRPLIEICTYSLTDAISAQSAGADRIELCSDASVGGVTPSHGVIETAREHLRIPLFVMIRPRGGNFVYSAEELTAMRRDIAFCRSLKVDGVVVGVLDRNSNVDRALTADLVAAAHPMEVTFHRAFDLTPGVEQAFEDIINAGCPRLLTSGHQLTALEGADQIHALVSLARGRIHVMPGSGIRSDNLAVLAAKTGAIEFHSSARMKFECSDSNFGFDDTHRLDPNEVTRLRQVADSLSLSNPDC